ncbi:unnamed protein product [Dimorphilus gyrociliatus]|uniref:Fatty acid desaturase domain-containing protein n=1 Tax=Dimorphilus gyrociliatus TaxID=2664684 RepID=A0A7I8VFW2_9ANNE|nr:unnamed protein product [Dimorphilus gyrociliatus]
MVYFRNKEKGEKSNGDVDEKTKNKIVYDRVNVKTLPSFSLLNDKVQKVVRSASWYERYGREWQMIGIMLLLFPTCIYMQCSSNLVNIIGGTLIGGFAYAGLSQRFGHLAVHGALTQSKSINKLLADILVQFFGNFPTCLVYDAHIVLHHPHTNIIDLGDSSIWKVPALPKIVYMLFAPFLLPVLTPVFGLVGLIVERKFGYVLQYLLWSTLGLVAHFLPLYYFGYSIAACLFLIFASKSVFTVPYIHINIFQHIGLPMYSNEARPPRVYQMSTGVLNLRKNLILDLVFGPALIDCHVEHHLFPKLSDSMCFRIKPLVKEYMKENNLPYHESDYSERFFAFMQDYQRLMKDAPPITHFIGIQ